ncbi:MAG: glycosyltransferase [Firmicutes bacterium]|nr:glycosyltransferase [Bacillota bacterium]
MDYSWPGRLKRHLERLRVDVRTLNAGEEGGPRILIMSASFGSGHVKAAEAVGAAVCQAEPSAWVGMADSLAYLNVYLSRAAEDIYWTTVRRIPRAYKFLYDYHDRSGQRIKELQGRIGVLWMARLVEEIHPDVIFSTHFFPAGAASHLQAKYGFAHAVVMTDYVPHQIWIYPGVDAYFVAHDGMRDYLLQMGVPAQRIHVTGIPVHPKFAAMATADVPALKEQLGLNPALPLVLVMAGGRGAGPLRRIFDELVRVVHPPFQVAVVAGRNRRAAEQLEERAKQVPFPAKVLGFVTNVEQWMAAASLMISKAGGLTVSEALATGVPMVIVDPVPGQEEGNTRFLLEHGAAAYAEHLGGLGALVGELLASPERLAQMRENGRGLARPGAAEEIARVLLGLARSKDR